MADIAQQKSSQTHPGAQHPILQQIDHLNSQFGSAPGHGQPVLIDGEPQGQSIGDDIVKLAQDGVNESIR